MAVYSPRVLSICSGIGGLDLGLKLAVPGARTVGYIERDSYAASVIVARMEDQALDEAPIWDNVGTFDGRRWRGTVDIIVAGFPFQPWSVAGSRAGTSDARWIWPDIARIIGEVGPGWVFLENVSGLVSGGGLAEVLGSMAGLGFDAEWACVRASDAGAPHRRERVFILARRRDEPGLVHERKQLGMADPEVDGRFQDISGTVGRTTGPIAGRESGTLADATGAGLQRAEVRGEHSGDEAADRRGGVEPQRGGGLLADPKGDLRGAPGDGGSESPDRRGDRSSADTVGLHRTVSAAGAAGNAGGEVVTGAGRGWDVDDPDGAGLQGRGDEPGLGGAHELDFGTAGPPLWPPGPNDRAEWGRIIARWPELAPATAEPPPVEPEVRQLAHGLSRSVLGRPVGSDRAGQLRALGNAVVPACAALAFTILRSRFEEA